MEQTVKQASFLLEWNTTIEQLIGVEPIFVLIIIAFVSLIAKVTKIRDRLPRYHDFALVAMVATLSVCISIWAIPFQGNYEVVRNAFVLSGVSTIVHNFGKPLYKGFKEWVYGKFEKFTGQDVED